VALALAEGRRSWEATARLVDGHLVLRFPEGLAGLDAPPQAQLEALAAAGLLETDPLTPLRRVRELGGVRGVLLTAEATGHVLRLAGAPPPVSQPVDPPTASAGAPPSPSAPTECADPTPATPPAARTKRRSSGATGNPRASRAATAAAVAELLARVRARDPALPGGVTEADGWLTVEAGALAALVSGHPGVSRYALLRALERNPACRLAPDGRIGVRAEP
jgi:hypothetical protein